MRKLCTIMVLLVCLTTTAQEKITANLTQDARLLFFGDDKGNDPGTIDLTLRVELQGKQQRPGFMFVAPEFEYADLLGGIYRRYSANVGYTFNQWLEGIHFTASTGIGILDYNGGSISFGANLQTAIKIAPGVYALFDLEAAERKDLLQWENSNKALGTAWVVSGKFGVKVELF